jgi:monofunctional glycosyltransferase
MQDDSPPPSPPVPLPVPAGADGIRREPAGTRSRPVGLASNDLPGQPDGLLMPPPQSRARRFGRCLAKLIAIAFGFSILMVVIYRVVPVPVTPLMLIRLLSGEALHKDWAPYDAISPQLARAVIASEDSGFCQHHGFDWSAIENAWDRNQHSPRIRGGSTISNQTAKNVFLWPDRNYVRKAVEYYFTALIEFFWPKRRILEVYLNVVEWGHGIYGAEAAARAHFGKPASALNRREAALLAAVLPNPRRWSASKPSAYIRSRAGTIQARMADVADPTGDPCRR